MGRPAHGDRSATHPGGRVGDRRGAGGNRTHRTKRCSMRSPTSDSPASRTVAPTNSPAANCAAFRSPGHSSRCVPATHDSCWPTSRPRISTPRRRCGLDRAGRARTRARRRCPGRHPRRPLPNGRRPVRRPRGPTTRAASARSPARPPRPPPERTLGRCACAGRTRSRTPVTTPSARSPCRRRDARPDLWAPLRRVLAMARPARRRFVGSAALGTAAEVCTIGLAGTAAWLIVRASEQPDLAALSVAILGVRAFGTGKGVFRYAERLATHDAGLRSLSEIRAAVVARLADIAPAGIPGWQRGDLLQRIVADIDRLLDLFVRVLGPDRRRRRDGAGSAGDHRRARRLDRSGAADRAGHDRRRCCRSTTMRGETSIGPALNEAAATFGGRVLAATEGLDHLWANRMLASARTRLDRVGRRHRRPGAPPSTTADVRRRRRRGRAAADRHGMPRAIAAMGPSLSGPVIGVLVLWPLAILELVGTVTNRRRRSRASRDQPNGSSPSSTPPTRLTRPPTRPRSRTARGDARRVTARWPGADVRRARRGVDASSPPATTSR